MTPAKPFRIFFGSCQDGVLKYVVWSFSDSGLALTVGSQQATISAWTAVGTDNPLHSEAVFVTSGTISVPTAFTVLEWSATQDGNTETGDVPTEPGLYDDYRVFEGTCRHNATLDDYKTSHPGMYPLAELLIRDVTLPPVVAYIHPDDVIYVDTCLVDDSPGSGKTTTGQPFQTLLQYDYALSWACGHGGLGRNDNDELFGCQYGRIDGFQYVFDHTRFLPIWGNHELDGQAGRADTIGGTLGRARPNSFHATGAAGVDFTGDGAGKLVYEAMLEPLHGQRLDVMRDTEAKHYYEDMGCWRLVFGDFVTRNEGSVSIGVYGSHFYGFDQTDDLLEMLGSEHPFKTLFTGPSTRPFSDGTANFNSLINFPLDYNRLLLNTGQTPKSLMDNPWTNGVYGSFTMDHGDSHSGGIKWHYAPADDGIAREHFYSIQLGSTTRVTGLHGRIGIEGDDPDASLYCEYRRYESLAENPTDYRLGPHLLERIVYGSEQPPRQHLRMWAETGTPGEFLIVWERHLIQHQSNRGLLSPATPKFSLAVGDA